MLTRPWNHFVIWDKDFGQPLHLNSVHFVDGLPPIDFSSNLRKSTHLYRCQGWDAWLPNAGHHQPHPRPHCIRKFGFPCAFSCDWSFFPLFSFSFFFFITANYVVPFAQMHKTNYVLSHPQLLFPIQDYPLQWSWEIPNPFWFWPHGLGEEGPLGVQFFLQCVQKMCPSVIKEFLKSGAPSGLFFSVFGGYSWAGSEYSSLILTEKY